MSNKQRPLTIQFDVDGVLADFIYGFTNIGHDLYGGLQSSAHNQVEWDSFPGLTKTQEENIWKVIRDSNFFWQSLPLLLQPLEVTAIRELYCREDVQIYFVTNRFGEKVRQQTEAWLRNRLDLPSWANPTLITSRNKGEVARAIMADFSIDDKAENAWCISWFTMPQNSSTPLCRSYLIDRLYNRYDSRVGSSKVLRIGSVQDFVQIIQGELDARQKE